MALDNFIHPANSTAGGMTSGGDYFTSPEENAAGGLADSTDEPPVRNQAQDHLDVLTSIDQMLKDSMAIAFGQNAASRWSGTPAMGLSMFRQLRADRKISGTDYFRQTGRIDGGIGTGDKATRDGRGNVTGYQSKGADWETTFGKKTDPTNPTSLRTGGVGSGPTSPQKWEDRFAGGMHSWDPKYPKKDNSLHAY